MGDRRPVRQTITPRQIVRHPAQHVQRPAAQAAASQADHRVAKADVKAAAEHGDHLAMPVRAQGRLRNASKDEDRKAVAGRRR